jgi:2-amino-4-hydroxy-6-hydroxymethyldihydropteridine diphosphokinase
MRLHHAWLLIGSNILPAANIPLTLRRLHEQIDLRAVSPVWETRAVNSDGPNFLNLVIEIATDLSPTELKYQVLRPLEASLGRVRSDDKNAPRTIDLDIMIYDEEILEPDLFRRAHMACPCSALLPDLIDPATGKTLSDISIQLAIESEARLRSDLAWM